MAEVARALRGPGPSATWNGWNKARSKAVLNASTFNGAKDLVRGQLARFPEDALPEDVRGLTEQLFAVTLPAWPETPVALCRGDSNLTNFVRREDVWSSVDWEYGGWGDPAFEMAEMTVHPAYAAVPSKRWPWVVARYCELTGDDHAAQRIRAYTLALSVWWTVRFARYLYEVPRELDPRLGKRPDEILTEVRQKNERYLALARRCFEEQV